jgi:hypothetical protein
VRGPSREKRSIACLRRSAGHFLWSGFREGIVELRRFPAIFGGMEPRFSATQTVWRRGRDSLFSFLYLRSVKGLTCYLTETAHLGIGRRIVAIVAVPCLLPFSSQIECTNRNSVYKKEDGPLPSTGKKNRPQKLHCSFAYSALASFRMGMSGSASFQRVRKGRAGCGKFYCGNPTLRTSSAKRGSERSESRAKSVLRLVIPSVRS